MPVACLASNDAPDTRLGVFECHGWATIRDTPGDEGLDDDPSSATLDAIRAAIAKSDLRHRVRLTNATSRGF